MQHTANWIIGPQITGLVLLVIGAVLHYLPPKHINDFYGYRMPSAMKNQQTWEEANRFAAIYLLKCGWVVIVMGLLMTTLIKEVNMPLRIKEVLTIFPMILSGIIPAVLLIVATEKHLSRIFGNQS